MSELRITSVIVIPEQELSESFILSSGAGGQNVNKVASAVQLLGEATLAALKRALPPFASVCCASPDIA